MRPPNFSSALLVRLLEWMDRSGATARAPSWRPKHVGRRGDLPRGTTGPALEALDMAIGRRCPQAGLLHHSDQGSTLGFKGSSQR